MKKRIALFCALIITISLSVTVLSAEVAEPKTGTTTTTSRIGGIIGGLVDGSNSDIKDKVSNVAGGLLDKVTGLSGIIDGIGDKDTSSVTYNIYTIIPVVTNSPQSSSAETTVQAAATVTESQGETVDYAATVNPFKKPTGALKPGDTGDGVKWLQWAFIYSHYGLPDNGITGVYDENTEAVVKKLQLESGLTVDGIANEEIINKAEVLYIQYRENLTSTAAATDAVTETVPTTADTTKKESNSKVVLIIVAIAIVWALVIAVIVFLFIAKKKKDKKDIEKLDAESSDTSGASDDSAAIKNDSSVSEAPVQPEKEPAEVNAAGDEDKSFSLADLFDEAEKNSK